MPEIFVGLELRIVSDELYDEFLRAYVGDGNECCGNHGPWLAACTCRPHHEDFHVAHMSDGLGNVTVVAIWDDLGKAVGQAAMENYIAGLAGRPSLVHSPCADPERGEHAPEGW